jgi:hypothetical protein
MQAIGGHGIAILKIFGTNFWRSVSWTARNHFRRRHPQPLILLGRRLAKANLPVQHRVIKAGCRKIATSARSKLKYFALLGVAPASPIEGKGACSDWLIGEHQGREIEQLCR